jgi:3-deoxy-D-manno-octulosonate 8-phosphate phosphatase (KDO 8-P phosphatase)
LISGKSNVSTQIRARYIGIPENLCFTGKVDKLDFVKNLMSHYNIGPEQVLVYGDDIPDLRIKLNGLAEIFASPANAPFYVMHEADIVISRCGGNHAFRLLMDLILYVQGGHEVADLIKKILSEE